MNVDGERTCPLCAEEMDLTDQQLKPCKCGYEVKVLSSQKVPNLVFPDSEAFLYWQGLYCSYSCFTTLL